MLKQTPLNAVHRAAGARMVDFGGWDMPVEYSGLIAEHLAVRNAVGIFDVSHMGEIEIRGNGALELIQRVSCNDAAKLRDGQAQYSGLLNEKGGFIDDLLVHRVAEDHYFLCVNATNQDNDFAWIESNNSGGVDLEFVSQRWGLLAVQGPKALATLKKLTGTDLDAIRYYWFDQGQVAGTPAIIAHTGYTGEDGFELYVPGASVEQVWEAVIQAGDEHGILPCGLGARNTLRLEAGMSLHGHEISEDISPLEAGLSWIAKLNKGDFIGRQALVRQKQEGVNRKLVGFEMKGRGIGRDGYAVHVEGEEAGWVTSGSPGPFIERNIGLAMMPANLCDIGLRIEIAVRSRHVEAEIVTTPFYSRKKDVPS